MNGKTRGIKYFVIGMKRDIIGNRLEKEEWYIWKNLMRL